MLIIVGDIGSICVENYHAITSIYFARICHLVAALAKVVESIHCRLT